MLDFVIDSYIKSFKNGEKNEVKYYQELLKKLLVHPTTKFSQDLKLMYIEELSFLCTKIKNLELPSQTKMK